MFLKVFKSIVTKHAHIVLVALLIIGGARSRNLRGNTYFWGGR